MAQENLQPHWLDRYATNHHAWTVHSSFPGHTHFKRPLGLVETTFDADGSYFGGRADMTALFTLAIRHTLSKEALRRRIVLAWTLLQLQHVLLMSRVEDDAASLVRSFVIDVPESHNAAVEKAEKGITWVEDLYDTVDEKVLFQHALNVARIITPTQSLSKLHVLPLHQRPDGTTELRLLAIIAHQISDGLSAYSWFSHLLRILNTPCADIEAGIAESCTQASLRKRLPPAQEDLYPPVSGSVVRQRWFWALVRVLRNVKKPFPPTFSNPLLRERRLERALAFEPVFDKLFDYSAEHRPPMSCGNIGAALSLAASTRLMQLCRAANVSIGAGCFALAGLSMMELHEERYPSVPDAERPAFAASFPLNPRAFFASPPVADSCMLAFSEGIVMPFLPSSLPIEGRFRLVAKHANRELKMYQKRLSAKKGVAAILDKHSPSRLLATGHLVTTERVDAKLPLERKSNAKPQGSLQPSVGRYGATCGVSSVGSIAPFFKPGSNDLNDMVGKDFVADYRDLRVGVRARDNEFLIGSSTNAAGIVGFRVSYDLNAISYEAAEMWTKKIVGLLERRDGSKL